MNSKLNPNDISVLVSVRSHEEATLAAKSGVDFIDAKEPNVGALGKLPISKIKEIVLALNSLNFKGKVTATYGDNISNKLNFNTKNFSSYFFLGLNALKIGFDARGSSSTEEDFYKLSVSYKKIIFFQNKSKAKSKITKLIPVLIIDNGFNIDFLEFMMRTQISKDFYGFMVDTKSKDSKNLFDMVSSDKLIKIFKKFNHHNLPYGMAGSLDETNSEIIKHIRPFWAGYRGGVCDGSRKGNLSKKKLKLIIDSLKIVQ